MSELSQRVKELKLARTPHTLTTFITFYMYHQHSMYINYMHDSKVILDWLTNEGNMPLDLESTDLNYVQLRNYYSNFKEIVAESKNIENQKFYLWTKDILNYDKQIDIDF